MSSFQNVKFNSIFKKRQIFVLEPQQQQQEQQQKNIQKPQEINQNSTIVIKSKDKQIRSRTRREKRRVVIESAISTSSRGRLRGSNTHTTTTGRNGENIFLIFYKMANTLSVMLRSVVSKKRRRYKEGGFDLDLAYICDNIIAMGYPGENIQTVFRNPISAVCHFFEVTHPEHYKVYNLRSEKAYDVNKFHGRVSVYAFEDHNPPTIELIDKFCNDVDLWLNKDPNNVAAIHCKAGKGRTGTMICCYLLYSRIKTTAEDALAYYGEKRTLNNKGVTIPSQRRYVQYYARLIGMKLKYERRTLQLCAIRFSPSTTLQSQGTVQCVISTMEEIDCTDCQTSKVHDIDSAGSWTKVTVKESNKYPMDFRKTFTLELDEPVVGDVKVELKKFFHFWFNTYFICDTAANEGAGEDKELIYTIPKWELDDAHKDRENKLFSEDFKVQLVLKQFSPHSRNNVDVSESAQVQQHKNHNNHVNSSTHNSHNNANMLLNQQMTHGGAIPTSSKSVDSTSVPLTYHNFIKHKRERSRNPSLPSFPYLMGVADHMPSNQMQNLMQRHHQQQQKRNSEPTPSVNPELINRSNNKNHNNSSHHQQQLQQPMQQQQQQQPQQHTHHHHNKSSNSNSSSNSSISSESSSSSVGVSGGGGGGGGVGEEEDWESGESSTTTTTSSSTTTTTPTTTSYLPYKSLISSSNDDDDDNLNKNDKNDNDGDDDGVALIDSDSTTKSSTTAATITTTTTTTTITTITTTTTTTISNSKGQTSPIMGHTNLSKYVLSIPPSTRPLSMFENSNQDNDDGVNAITAVNRKDRPLPVPLPPPATTSSTNGLQQGFPTPYITPISVKPRHMNFFHKKVCEPPSDDSGNQKLSITPKCTTARSKFLKLINSQRFKAKSISPAMGSSLALNSTGLGSACATAQNQLLKKKKAKSKKIPPTKTFQWLQNYFRTDPDFHENLEQQTTIPMGRRNSAGSISSRNHLNSVGSASGIGRAGSVEKGFRVGSLESRGIPADFCKSDDEDDCHFVGLHGTGPKVLLDKSSGAVKKSSEDSILKEYCITIPTKNTSAIEDSKTIRKCNLPSGLNKHKSDYGVSLGTSPVEKALRNIIDVGTQLSSMSPTRDKGFTYESDSDHSMSQSNAAALLTRNNFRPTSLDTSNCDEKCPDVAASCLPRVALGKTLPPSNERTTSIGSSNYSTSMDHLSVPYSNMYLQTQSTLDDGGDTEVYHNYDHDHYDHYSSICDKQLSFNNSPCKSPRSLSDILDLKPAITHRNFLRQAGGSSPSANSATASASSGATVASSRQNTISNDGIVIAKPVESHSIGFNVELTSAMTSSTSQTTEKYNTNVDCDNKDSSKVFNVKSTPAKRKPPVVDSILNLIIIKSIDPTDSAPSVDDGSSGEVGDNTDSGAGDVSPNNPKAGGSTSSSSGYCCASEGSQSVSSTSSGVVDTISSSGTAFSLERSSLDNSSVVVINSKKKLSLPTPEIEVGEFGITKNRSSSVSNT